MTTINPKAEAALRQPDTRSVSYEMTPERKERFKVLTRRIVDILKSNCESPIEAYMCLQFVVEGFEHSFDIRGAVIVTHDEKH